VAGLIVILAVKTRSQAELNVSLVADRRVKSEPNTQLAVQHRELVKSEADQRLGVKNPQRGKSNESINGKL